MSDITSTAGFQGVAEVVDTVAQYLPEPATKVSQLFGDVMDVVAGVGKTAIGGVSTQATGDFGELIQLQIEVQREMQITTMVSNIEKSKHESKMSAIRNIRVG